MGAVVQMRRGVPPRPGREFLRMFPVGGDSRTWLYAVGLPDGRVKLGISARPRERIGMYLTQHGSLNWAHVGACVKRDASMTCSAERASLFMASTLSKREGKSEYFIGLTKRQAMSCLRYGATA